MTPRIDVAKYLNSAAGRAMLSFSGQVEAGLERSLFELI